MQPSDDVENEVERVALAAALPKDLPIFQPGGHMLDGGAHALVPRPVLIAMIRPRESRRGVMVPGGER